MKLLDKRACALKDGYRQNIALTGQMLSGKSSILYQFLHTRRDQSLIPVYVEVKHEPFYIFANKFIATLLYNYLRSCKKEVKNDLYFLMNEAGQHIPRTIASIKKIIKELEKKHNTSAYQGLLKLTSTLREESGKSCIVILDEFHNLEHFKIKNPYRHFGKIIMIQKDTMYIVSSSQKSAIEKILFEKLSLLFGNFEIVEVTGFEYNTCIAFLKEKLKDYALGEELRDYLVDFTAGNPFYLEVISKKIIEVCSIKGIRQVGCDIIAEVISSLIYNANGTINQYFTNNILTLFEKTYRSGLLAVLIGLSCGHNTRSGLAEYMNTSKATLNNKLRHLIKLDIVYKNGVFYELYDKVFKFWLRNVYYKKESSLIDGVNDTQGDFEKLIKKDIEEFIKEHRKDAVLRLKELFYSFDGETIKIDGKMRKLPKITGLSVYKGTNYADFRMVLRDEKLWVARFYDKNIEFSDVNNFLENYKPLKDKIRKKIFISLKGIEDNALLLAKEKQIWVWSFEDINGLMKLFKKREFLWQ